MMTIIIVIIIMIIVIIMIIFVIIVWRLPGAHFGVPQVGDAPLLI